MKNTSEQNIDAGEDINNPETVNAETPNTNASAEEVDAEIEDFKPFSVRKFFFIIGGILFAIFAALFVVGFIAGLSGTRPASFDSDILQNQVDEMLGNDEENTEVPNELEKNE